MRPQNTAITLQTAGVAELAALLPLVRAYHEFEQVDMSDQQRREALAPLLQPDSPLGRVWLLLLTGDVVGYVALCFGYSIEFRGRDAFVDELYVEPGARGRGVASAALARVMREAAQLGIVALHLEVARSNERARRLYRRWGFESREQFHMMSCYLEQPVERTE